MKNYLITFFLLSLVLLVACQENETTLATTRLSIIATEMIFDSGRLEATAGYPVQLTLKNDGSLEHDFTIATMPHDDLKVVSEMADTMAGHQMDVEADVHIAAGAGKVSIIQFTPTKGGTYQFYCTVAGHQEAGMIGTLIVQAP